MPIASTLSLKDTSISFVGDHDHSAIAFQGRGVLVVERSTIVFDGVNFQGQPKQKLLEPFIFKDEQSSITVQNSMIKDGPMALDRVTFLNVQFVNVTIHYHGGPVRLANVSFNNCDLSALPPLDPVATALTERIKMADGQPFSYVSEGTRDFREPE